MPKDQAMTTLGGPIALMKARWSGGQVVRSLIETRGRRNEATNVYWLTFGEQRELYLFCEFKGQDYSEHILKTH